MQLLLLSEQQALMALVRRNMSTLMDGPRIHAARAAL
jgi:hypothetical protein